jgi:hypothetical protein
VARWHLTALDADHHSLAVNVARHLTELISAPAVFGTRTRWTKGSVPAPRYGAGGPANEESPLTHLDCTALLAG